MHKHIINGLSAAGGLREYLREPVENFSVFEDSLLIGPLYSMESEENSISQRAKFWENPSYNDTVYIIKSYKKFISDIKEADSFTLWLAPVAHDQIMWTWLVHLFDLYQKDWKNIRVKHLNSNIPYLCLGHLAPEKFTLCQYLEITEIHKDFLRNAFKALISDTPELLLKICHQENSPLLELQKSFKTYLKSYPDERSGLNVYDRGLLINCKKMQLKSARIIGDSIAHIESEDRLRVGDQYLFDRLVKLSQIHLKNPLVKLHRTVKDNSSMRFTEVEITDLGQAVLDGTENHVQLNGIDEWIGGVHLSSKEKTALWFYKDGDLIKS